MGYPARKTVDSIPLFRRWKLRRKGRGASWGKRAACPLFLILTLFLMMASGVETRTGIFSDPLPTHYRTQGRFIAALDRPISATWKGVALRSVLRRLSHEREVSILLDRRVDPDQEVEIDTGERSLRSAVDEIAHLAHQAVSRVGNCLVVAPPAAAFRLRTLVALREKELAARDVDFSESPGPAENRASNSPLGRSRLPGRHRAKDRAAIRPFDCRDRTHPARSVGRCRGPRGHCRGGPFARPQPIRPDI